MSKMIVIDGLDGSGKATQAEILTDYLKSRGYETYTLDLPFYKVGIAHLACSLMAPNYDDYIATLNAIPDAELERLFAKCASLGVGIELNLDDMNYKIADEDIILRMFRVAKAQVTVDLPTPPLPLTTPITRFTLLTAF